MGGNGTRTNEMMPYVLKHTVILYNSINGLFDQKNKIIKQCEEMPILDEHFALDRVKPWFKDIGE